MKKMTLLFLLLAIFVNAQWDFTYSNTNPNSCTGGSSFNARLSNWNWDEIPNDVTHVQIVPRMDNGRYSRVDVRQRKIIRNVNNAFSIREGYNYSRPDENGNMWSAYSDITYYFIANADYAVNSYGPLPEDRIRFQITKRVYRCQTDYDLDGIVNDIDDCPTEAGPASNNGCPVDSDGDGVNDNVDDCPTEPGPASNNGCPLDSDGDGIPDDEDSCPNTPNLGVDIDNDGIDDACDTDLPMPDIELNPRDCDVTSQCVNCNSQLSSLGNNKHLITNRNLSNSVNISLDIKNYGVIPLNDFILSTNLRLYGSEDIILNLDNRVVTVNPGNTEFLTITVFSSLLQNNNIPFSNNYYIEIKADPDNYLNEGNEENNILRIPLKYVNANTVFVKDFPRTIYDFRNNIVAKAYNLKEYEHLLLKLKKGVYIVRNKDGKTKKIKIK